MSYLMADGRLPNQAQLLNEETALVAGDGLYYLDSTRGGKWLSAHVYSYQGGNGAAISNAYLLFEIGGRFVPPYGWRSADDLVLVGLEYATDIASADANYTVEVRSNGVALHIFKVGTALFSNAKDIHVDFPKNVDFSFFMNGTGAGKVNVVAHFRAKATQVP